MNNDGAAAGCEQNVQPHLQTGEMLLWCGRPKQGLIFRSSDWGLIPFSVMWCAGAIAWEARAVRFICPAIIGIPFILVGLQMLIGRYIVDIKQRRNLCYALTNRRAIMVSGRPAPGVVSYVLADVNEVDLIERSDGSGSIRFIVPDAKKPKPNSWQLNNMPEVEVHRQFEFIQAARDVYAMISQVRSNSKKSASL